MHLPEDHFPFRAVLRPPGTNAPLERAPDPIRQIGVAPTQLLEHGHRPQLRAACSIGTTSISKTSASGSARRRALAICFWEGRRRSSSIRYALATLIAAFAAATATDS